MAIFMDYTRENLEREIKVIDAIEAQRPAFESGQLVDDCIKIFLEFWTAEELQHKRAYYMRLLQRDFAPVVA